MRKISQRYHCASKQRETYEVGKSFLVPDQQPSVVLQPRYGSFNYPSVFVAAQLAAILCLVFLLSVASVWRYHVNSQVSKHDIQSVGVIGLVTNQIPRRGGHIIEPFHGLLDKLGLSERRTCDARSEGNPFGINANLNFGPFSLFGQPDTFATALGWSKGRVNEALFHVQSSATDQLFDNRDHDFTESVIVNPNHQVVMNGGFRRECSRKVFPLYSSVQDKKNGFKDISCVSTRSATFRFFRNLKMGPQYFPLLVGQKHITYYSI